MRSMIVHLPDGLADQVEAFVAAQGTTMDALVRSQLEAVVVSRGLGATPILEAFSKGLLSRSEAIRNLGLRDYASLLVALGDAGFSMPCQDPHELDEQASGFERLWRSL